MILLNIVYDEDKEDIINEIKCIKDDFKNRNVNIGLCENMINEKHIVKIICDDKDYNEKILRSLELKIAELLYKKMIGKFHDTILDDFLTETYFFLKYEEIVDIKYECMQALKCKGQLKDENMIYYMNRKNSVIKKITKCIQENNEINIEGFMIFRMAQIKEDLISIVDKVIEKYMIEKEYDEFINLLKYFVEMQESKMDELNIIIKENGEYLIKDGDHNDIMSKFMQEICDVNDTGKVNAEDLIISGLITNVPKKIIIHCVENCTNKEFIQTIEKVFQDRVNFCEECKLCQSIKHIIKV